MKLLPILVLGLSMTACLPKEPLTPLPGRATHRDPGIVTIPVPGHTLRVDLAGGNLLLHREDWTIDTKLEARMPFTWTYNSATNQWKHSYEWLWVSDLNRVYFPDGSVGALQPDGSIPGHPEWRQEEGFANSLVRQDGMVYEFHAQHGYLVKRYRKAHAQVVQTFSPYANSVVEHAPDPRGVWRKEKDSEGTEWLDRAGRVVQIDNEHRVVYVPIGSSDTEGRLEYQYDNPGSRLSGFVTPDGDFVEIGMDDEGRVKYVTAYDLSHTFAYRHDGGVYTSSQGGITVTSVTPVRAVDTVLHPDGTESTYVWDTALRLQSLIRPEGTTHWEFLHEDLVRIQTPDGEALEIEYDSHGVSFDGSRPIRRVWDSIGIRFLHHRDHFGRVVMTEDGEARITARYEYTDEGFLRWAMGPRGETTTYDDFHPEHGHPREVTTLGSDELFDPSRTERREYDRVGNLTEGSPLATPGLSRIQYDDRRQPWIEIYRSTSTDPAYPTSVVLGPDRELEWVRRWDGQPKHLFHPYGYTTQWTYEEGVLTRRHEAGSHGVSDTVYTLSDDARTHNVTHPDGRQEFTVFDVAGRINERKELDSEGNVQASVEYHYDRLDGRLSHKQDSIRGLTTVEWDEQGRLTRMEEEETSIVLRRTYDGRGRVKVAEYTIPGAPAPLKLRHIYDASDRLRSVYDDVVAIWYATYRPDGQMESEHDVEGLPQPFYFEYSSDPGHRKIVGHEGTLAATREGDTIQISWGEESYILGPYSDTPGFPSVGPRLLADTLGSWDVNAMGNAARDDVPVSWSPDGMRLLQRGENAYSYDAGGRVTHYGDMTVTYHRGLPSIVESPFTFRMLDWDAERQLFQIAGSRVSLDGALVNGLLTYKLPGVPTLLVWDTAVDDLSFRYLDSRGNPIRRPAAYSGYGRDPSAGIPTGERGFAQGHDQGLGLTLLGPRLLEAETGRFWQPDPVWQPLNPYAYALGNPVHFWDPTGHQFAPYSHGELAWGVLAEGIDLSGSYASEIAGGFGVMATYMGITGNTPGAAAAGVAGGVVASYGFATPYASGAARFMARQQSPGARAQGALLSMPSMSGSTCGTLAHVPPMLPLTWGLSRCWLRRRR